MSAPDIAAVVVTHNSEHVVEDLLDSLPAALGSLTADVVVVDNGSTDDTCSIVQARQDCTLVRSTNIGYAAGVNLGVRRADPAGAILVLNPDVRLYPESVEALARSLDRPGVGIVAPQIRGADGRLHQSLRREPTVRRALGLSRTGIPALSEAVSNVSDYLGPRRVDWAVGAALLISRACDTALGGWNESYFLYSEETDFAARARALGFAIWYEPGAVVVHIGAQSGTSERTHSMQVLNRVRYYARRHGRLVAWPYYTASIIGELSKIRAGTQHRAALRSLLRPASRPSELRCSYRQLPL